MRRVLLLIFTGFLFFCGCKKSSDQQSGQLRITIKDETSHVVPGVTVQLYKLQDNIPQNTGITGNDGSVIFSGLSLGDYLWRSNKGCLSNPVYGVQPIGRATTVFNYDNQEVETIIYNSAILTLINTSSSDYNIVTQLFSVRDQFLGANSSRSYKIITGNHLIHIEPVGNPALGRDTLINFNCGDSVAFRFP